MNYYNSRLHDSVAEMASKQSKRSITFDVQRILPIDDDTARLLISVPTVFRNRLDDMNMTMAVASVVGEDVRYLPGSLHRTDARNTDLLSIFVKKNRRTCSLEQASANHFEQISDTVFQDEDDRIWSVVNDGTASYLVADSQEDVASLLRAVQTRAIATASVAIDLSQDYATGEFVKYYNLRRECASFGIAISGREVYDPTLLKALEVSSDCVIAVQDGQFAQIDTAAVGNGDRQSMLNYYRTLYADHREYLQRLEDIINQSTAV